MNVSDSQPIKLKPKLTDDQIDLILTQTISNIFSDNCNDNISALSDLRFLILLRPQIIETLNPEIIQKIDYFAKNQPINRISYAIWVICAIIDHESEYKSQFCSKDFVSTLIYRIPMVSSCQTLVKVINTSQESLNYVLEMIPIHSLCELCGRYVSYPDQFFSLLILLTIMSENTNIDESVWVNIGDLLQRLLYGSCDDDVIKRTLQYPIQADVHVLYKRLLDNGTVNYLITNYTSFIQISDSIDMFLVSFAKKDPLFADFLIQNMISDKIIKWSHTAGVFIPYYTELSITIISHSLNHALSFLTEDFILFIKELMKSSPFVHKFSIIRLVMSLSLYINEAEILDILDSFDIFVDLDIYLQEEFKDFANQLILSVLPLIQHGLEQGSNHRFYRNLIDNICSEHILDALQQLKLESSTALISIIEEYGI